MKALQPIVVICFFIFCANANAPDLTIRKAFDAFLIKHSKVYDALEYVKRFAQFVKIYKFVFS